MYLMKVCHTVNIHPRTMHDAVNIHPRTMHERDPNTSDEQGMAAACVPFRNGEGPEQHATGYSRCSAGATFLWYVQTLNPKP